MSTAGTCQNCNCALTMSPNLHFRAMLQANAVIPTAIQTKNTNKSQKNGGRKNKKQQKNMFVLQ